MGLARQRPQVPNCLNNYIILWNSALNLKGRARLAGEAGAPATRTYTGNDSVTICAAVAPPIGNKKPRLVGRG